MTRAAVDASRYTAPTTIRLSRSWTATERIVARGVAAGLSYAEIALTLPTGRSARTVRVHVMRMAQAIVGLDAAVPPRTAVWLVMRMPEILAAIMAEIER